MPAIIAAFEWVAWEGFMLTKLYPNVVRIRASPLHSADEILSRCPPGLDVFAFHLNCTFSGDFPQDRERLIHLLEDRGVRILNGKVTDISKRSVQATCKALGLPSVGTFKEEGAPNDLVIAKTNGNSGALPDLLLAKYRGCGTDSLQAPLPIRGPEDYRVLRRMDVPEAWWHHPGLVVENFVSNSLNRRYRVYMFGSQYCILVSENDNMIQKVSTDKRSTLFMSNQSEFAAASNKDLPVQLQYVVSRFVPTAEMDFGAIDVLENDRGECFVIDVNSTSMAHGLSREGVAHLRKYLECA